MRRFIILCLLIAFCTTAVGQRRYGIKPTQRQLFNRQGRNAISFNLGGGGASFLVGSDQDVKMKIGGGGGLDFTYNYFWDRNWGIHVGLGALYSTSGIKADEVISESIGTITAYNHSGEATRTSHYTATTTNFAETFTSVFLEVPILMAYQQDHFWLDFGVKAILPISMKSAFDYGETSIGVGTEIDGFGQSVPIPVEINRVAMQEGDYKVASLGGGIAYPWYALVHVSGGYRWAINELHVLKVGLYANFAINQTNTDTDRPLVLLDGGNVNFSNAVESDAMKSLRYINVGLTITYDISFGEKISYHRPQSSSRGSSVNSSQGSARYYRYQRR